MNRTKFTREFKLAVVNELESGTNTVELSKKYNIHPSMVFRWRRQVRQYPQTAFSGNGHAYTLEAQLADKERLIGKLYAENQFLKKVIDSLRAWRARQNGR